MIVSSEAYLELGQCDLDLALLGDVEGASQLVLSALNDQVHKQVVAVCEVRGHNYQTLALRGVELVGVEDCEDHTIEEG